MTHCRVSRIHGRRASAKTLPPNIGCSDWQDSIVDDRRTPVLDQVCFRIDFPAWLRRLSSDQRRLAEMLVTGHPAYEVARKLNLTPARVSQIRKILRDDWRKYQDELEVASVS